MMSAIAPFLPSAAVGWIPFFSPINWFHDWWFLLALPLAFLISMTYRAMRYRLERTYWSSVWVMTIQILLGMMTLMLLLLVIVEWIVPTLLVR